jgi:hypothetical protein
MAKTVSPRRLRGHFASTSGGGTASISGRRKISQIPLAEQGVND